jgi:hypothetical protein
MNVKEKLKCSDICNHFNDLTPLVNSKILSVFLGSGKVSKSHEHLSCIENVHLSIIQFHISLFLLCHGRDETISDKPRERMAVTFNLEPSVPGGQVKCKQINK